MSCTSLLVATLDHIQMQATAIWRCMVHKVNIQPLKGIPNMNNISDL